MASTANFVLMALFLLLAISEQALSVKPESSFHGQGDEYVLNNKTSLKKTASPPETTPSHASYDPTEPKPPPINDTDTPVSKSPPLPPRAPQLPGGIWTPRKKPPHHIVNGRVVNSVVLALGKSPDPRVHGPVIAAPTPSIAPDIPNTYNTRGVKALNEPDPDFEAPPSPKVSSVQEATRP